LIAGENQFARQVHQPVEDVDADAEARFGECGSCFGLLGGFGESGERRERSLGFESSGELGGRGFVGRFCLGRGLGVDHGGRIGGGGGRVGRFRNGGGRQWPHRG